MTLTRAKALHLMSVLEPQEKFRAFTAIASEYSYRSVLTVCQAPQHRRRVGGFTRIEIVQPDLHVAQVRSQLH